ncbi:hypothetical protein DPMN_145031 [Dreissena polymorpha]|uniref:Uncharacterized protein n=1 Tax=Dreissena polymorpha TaxID=45954 RepID=A0A9D4F472_DREPO|nr:hypothetical protein DPMN_145031 [Dreissena polymorpha]
MINSVTTADYLDELFDSDSDESEFSGFSEFDSHIEVGDLSDDDIIPDAESADDNWTDDFSPLRTRRDAADRCRGSNRQGVTTRIIADAEGILVAKELLAA